tara:strand:+ start:46066 stop:47085 length:1020 start_codon:yes stop_codon:yes gene_type:complete
MLPRIFIAGLALCLLGGVAQADQLAMKNGSLLIGTLVSADETHVIFATPFAGEISIQKANIKTIVTDARVNVLLQDGAVYKDKRIVEQGDDLIILSDDESPVRVDVPTLRLINPEPWRLGEGYKWFGRANAALESERGNTDTDELDMDLESVWRSLRDRYTVRGNWEIDEANNERNKYSWMLRNKYDRFSSDDPDNYLGFQALFERDEFADLDLRTGIGPYIGRQFLEAPLATLHGEVGVVRVNEYFDAADDNDYWGANWELRLTSEILPGLELYADQLGVLNFSDADALIVNTTVGLRFPLVFGLEASAEAKYEFDGGAVEGVDDTDETYNVKLGYKW